MRPFVPILGVVAVACGALWFSLPGRAPQAAVPDPGALAARSEPAPPPAQIEACDAPTEREPNPQIATEAPGVRPLGPEPAELAQRALAAAAEVLVSTDFRAADFEQRARAIAAGMRAETQAQLVLLAGDARLSARERVVCAEILRHRLVRTLPEPALGSLREAWSARESEPALASAAVRALGAYGSAEDRRALLEQSVDGSQPSLAALALAGLSAARGDEAALELAALAEQGSDPRRAEVGLAALSSVASADPDGLSDATRAKCAETLERSLEGTLAPQGTRARALCALAALDPARARR